MAKVKERWRHIPGFPGYMASNLGRLKSKRKQVINGRSGNLCWRPEKLMTAKPDKTGYLSHCMKSTLSTKKNWLAHRLIGFAWIRNPINKRFINHKNGIKTDNRVENLEWVTKSENGIHAVNIGLHTPLRGESNGNSKLNKAQVKEIRSLRGKLRDSEVAKSFGIGRTTVMYIWQKKLWKHL